MFDAKKTQNAIKYLKECEGSLNLPEVPYKDYYNKCVHLLEVEMAYLCFMILVLLKERSVKR